MKRVAQFVIVALSAGLFAQPVFAGTREVTLSASERRVTYGDAVELTGQVTDSDGDTSCSSDVEVTLLADPFDDMFENWHVVGYDRTDDEGRFKELVSPFGSAYYMAEVADEPSGCAAAASDVTSVRVRARVVLKPLERRVEPSEPARLRVVVEPLCHDGFRIVKFHLYQFRHGGFREVAARRPEGGCELVFRRRVGETAVFQARVGRIDALHWLYLSGRSDQQVVGVAR